MVPPEVNMQIVSTISCKSAGFTSSVSWPAGTENSLILKPQQTSPPPSRQPEESSPLAAAHNREWDVSAPDYNLCRIKSTASSQPQLEKRVQSVEDDNDAVTVASAAKRSRYVANYIAKDPLDWRLSH